MAKRGFETGRPAKILLLRAALVLLLFLAWMGTASPVDAQSCGHTPGLVGWWRGESNALDASGCGNHGSIEGSVNFTQPLPNPLVFGFQFNGQPGHVKVPQAPSLNPGNQVTVAFWYRPHSAADFDVCCSGLVTTDFYLVEISRGGINFVVSPSSGSSFPDTGGGVRVSANEWHHIAATYDGVNDGLKLYVDGNVAATNPAIRGAISPMLAGSYLSIGSEDGRTTCPFCVGTRYANADIDEVYVFNRVLTQTQVQEIALARNAAIVLNDSVLDLRYSQLTAPSNTFSGDITATHFFGDGSGLTNLNLDAGNLIGTIDDSHLSGNVARRDVGNVFGPEQTFNSGLNIGAAGSLDMPNANPNGATTGWIRSGIRSILGMSASNATLLNASSLSGGAVKITTGGIESNTLMTVLNSGNVGIGTALPSTKFEVIGNIRIGGPGQLVFPDGTTQSTAAFNADLTNLNASNLTSGTVPDGRLVGSYTNALSFPSPLNSFAGIFSGDGASLTNLNAGNLATGTVADARLSSNVAVRNAANSFGSVQTFNGGLDVAAGSSINLPNADTNGAQGGWIRSGIRNVLGMSGSNATLLNASSLGGGAVKFVTNGIESNLLMTVQNSGNVGIGTASPSHTLEVIGNIKIGGPGRLVFPDGTMQSTAAFNADLTNLNASNLTMGTLPDGRLNGVYSGALTLRNPSNSFGGTFAGDGSGLSNVHAVTADTATNALALGGLPALNYARLDAPFSQQFNGVIVAPTIVANWRFTPSAPAGAALAAINENFDGIGVLAHARFTSGRTVGVSGTVSSFDGTAGLFNNQRGGNILVGQNNGANVFRVDGSGIVYARRIAPVGADFAESFAVLGQRADYAPGDVMVIDVTGNRRLARSSEAYSTLVAGVYSTEPGVLSSPHGDAERMRTEVPLAVVGVVPCKVSAENGPIQRGDLLVTSATPGHAMKGTDRNRMLGAVVGKALEPLAEGTGVIQVLVVLQ